MCREGVETRSTGAADAEGKGKGKAAAAAASDGDRPTNSASTAKTAATSSQRDRHAWASPPPSGPGMLQDLAQTLASAVNGKSGGAARLDSTHAATAELARASSSRAFDTAAGGTAIRGGSGSTFRLQQPQVGSDTETDASYAAFAVKTAGGDTGVRTSTSSTLHPTTSSFLSLDRHSGESSAASRVQLAAPGIYSSSGELDASLHAYVRASSLSVFSSLFEEKEEGKEEQADSLADQFYQSAVLDGKHDARGTEAVAEVDASFEHVWAAHSAGTQAPPASLSHTVAPVFSKPGAGHDEFMSLLAQEEAQLGPVSQEPSGLIHDLAVPSLRSPLSPSPALAGGEERPAPRTPSQFFMRHVFPRGHSNAAAMTSEQYNLHLALDAQQTAQGADADPARLAERIVPPDTNAAARKGVYALTPEEAFRHILQGTELQQTQQEGAATAPLRSVASEVERLKRHLPRETYVDVSLPRFHIYGEKVY
ncbi:hypothetical protein K437DRAFT_98641 [Tilletiaria anomala UBC 951]|uniref:Uncharacterized protein n=1 Tax=Tilletiaria anomala (strain ATCC 24038 / CBS 436.72 / UBC 951) TaxID=1037660 RepID=A0A066WHP0_TILAU|nr:uncharacterized protein K437DRAFT_98641 [Tilletiaria anomala UBC 951]KDN53316.1 hypothetical protein K437DRAFT_98641 [Tilletiaria anomala UBC 951]